MTNIPGNAPGIFAGTIFTIIPCEELDNREIERNRRIIESQGGEYRPLDDNDQHIPGLEQVTHIISTHIDFRQYTAALEHGIDVVKPSWVAHSLGKGKQVSARQYSPDPSQFFQDVVFTCGDLPPGDVRAITAGVMVLGGQYSGPLTKIVTHIVTMSLDDERCRIAEEKELGCKIVLPHWIDACLKLGKKISEKPYLLPDPEILRAEHGTSIRSYPTPHLSGATVATPSGLPCSTPPISPSKSRRSLNALSCKRVFFSKDLEISAHIHKTLKDLIHSSGGSCVSNIDAADIYIGQFRDGSDFVSASRAGKEVANLSWLYHVINQNRYSNPLNKLLHYPVPRHGIPGFENMKISISNYSGDARTYVENLVRYCGAEFTKTMKQDNTHLVTAHTQSEKCEAAQEWNINVVNHLWLEESYAKCAVQTLSNPKYNTFPARTNLGEVAGQISLDMKSVERAYFPKSRSPQKPKSPARPSDPVVADPPAKKTIETTERPTPPLEENDTGDNAEPSTTKKQRGRPRKPVSTPRVSDDKENESPMVLSVGRASKARAMDNLHQQAGDIALFQKEMKRKGGVVHGGRRSSHADDFASPAPATKTSRKRTSEEFDDSETDEEMADDGETPKSATKQSKKSRTTLPEIHTRMMVTGYDRWKDDKHIESSDRDKLRMLGVALTTKPNAVDVLVAPRLLRTRKFVSALACAPMVVDLKYLETALTKSKLIEKPALLHDREGEERMGFRLVDALQRARENQGKLLRGWSIFVTKDVNGGFETFKEIITVNGGAAFLYQGRTGMQLPKRRLRDDPQSGEESQNQGGADEFDYVYLVSGNSENDQKLWRNFRNVAHRQEVEARIVTTDWLLNAAMSQQITFDEKWLL
ncbi:uncharacterized protein K489DRAFT_382001 [Dissoconium aciculare CBS 342.82]|uniref:BRCT domain-containing protein n=1 Tax=Dissoconium aciculare CBS 342.82 TaxID=1314786 RepID=A0A6J3LZ71_9PEZI|nr:uncharacterized protein K489DRAFT_382001 [Dissoconium aciculare CBS 342.82]KAF1820958.1 hypothetical protein K489DRAFT_382001 [Dissoconium aciculare CBS 342.82]